MSVWVKAAQAVSRRIAKGAVKQRRVAAAAINCAEKAREVAAAFDEKAHDAYSKAARLQRIAQKLDSALR